MNSLVDVGSKKSELNVSSSGSNNNNDSDAKRKSADEAEYVLLFTCLLSSSLLIFVSSLPLILSPPNLNLFIHPRSRRYREEDTLTNKKPKLDPQTPEVCFYIIVSLPRSFFLVSFYLSNFQCQGGVPSSGRRKDITFFDRTVRDESGKHVNVFAGTLAERYYCARVDLLCGISFLSSLYSLFCYRVIFSSP